jgi:hypothetical protein
MMRTEVIVICLCIVVGIMLFTFSRQNVIIISGDKEEKKPKKQTKQKVYETMNKYEYFSSSSIRMGKSDAYRFVNIPIEILHNNKGQIECEITYESVKQCDVSNEGRNESVKIKKLLSTKTARAGFTEEPQTTSDTKFTLELRNDLVLIAENNEELKVHIHLVIFSPITKRFRIGLVRDPDYIYDSDVESEQGDDE